MSGRSRRHAPRRRPRLEWRRSDYPPSNAERREQGQDDVSGPRRGRDPARERIAAAMIEAVADHGFTALDVATVCAAADVSHAHFNRCFADLEDCFLALHDEAMEELCARVD